MRLSKVFFLVFLILLGEIVYSQQYSFKSFSVEHGLAQSQVTALIQDKNGFLWFGTNGGGLSRFDGHTFHTFNTQNGLIDNMVLNLFQDSKGRIWIGTEGGLSCYDGASFINYGGKYGLNVVEESAEDKNGILWFADYENGLFSFDGRSFRKYSISEGLIAKTARNLAFDTDGNIWVATNHGVSRFNGKSFQNFTQKEGLLDIRTRVIFCDRSGALWFGHNNGISRFDGRNFTHFTEKQGLIKGRIADIHQDSRGNIWICGDGGICYYDGNVIRKIRTTDDPEDNLFNCSIEDSEGNIWAGTDGKGVLQLKKSNFFHMSSKDGLPNKSVFGIMKDRKGNLWLGSQGGGITVFDGKSHKSYTAKNGLSDNNVYGFLEQADGSILIITSAGLNKFENGKFSQIRSLAKEEITRIIKDSRGDLWIGSFNGLVRLSGGKLEKFPIEDSLKSVTVVDIMEDHAGKLWVCTRSNGIRIFDGNKFTELHLPVGSSYKPWSIVEDKSHNLWIGLYGNGIMRYDPLTNKFSLLSTRDGLIDDNILSMLIDKKGFIWLGTNSGICKINTEEFNKNSGKPVISNYGPGEGFTGIECNENAVYLDNEGNVWFGTLKGVSRYNVAGENEAKNMRQPQTHITEVRLIFSSKSISDYSKGIDRNSGLPAGLRLPYNLNYISFKFAGISLTSPEKVRYQYMLSGIDKDWSPVTASNEASYSNLPPGNYTMLVKACNNDGIWNDRPASFS
ncbi:MAG: two-component regulator propeller domain-containing protein, partial [Syntrophothermus sp.]